MKSDTLQPWGSSWKSVHSLELCNPCALQMTSYTSQLPGLILSGLQVSLILLLSVKLPSVLTSRKQLGSVEDHPHLVALWHKCHNTCSFIIKKNLKTQKMKNELILGTSAYGLKRNSTRLLNSCFSDV